MFEIDLSPLTLGVHHLTQEMSPEALQPPVDEEPPEEASSGEEDEDAEEPHSVTEDVVFGPASIDAVVDYQPDRVLVTFQAHATAEMTCDRTLRRFEQPLEGQYAVLFSPPEREAPDRSDDHDEVRDLPPGARHLDLTDAVRDTLLLAIPQRKVAPGAEEEDIDTVFGSSGEDDIDPRWEKLRQLKGDDASGGDAADGDASGGDPLEEDAVSQSD